MAPSAKRDPLMVISKECKCLVAIMIMIMTHREFVVDDYGIVSDEHECLVQPVGCFVEEAEQMIQGFTRLHPAGSTVCGILTVPRQVPLTGCGTKDSRCSTRGELLTYEKQVWVIVWL